MSIRWEEGTGGPAGGPVETWLRGMLPCGIWIPLGAAHPDPWVGPVTIPTPFLKDGIWQNSPARIVCAASVNSHGLKVSKILSSLPLVSKPPKRHMQICGWHNVDFLHSERNCMLFRYIGIFINHMGCSKLSLFIFVKYFQIFAWKALEKWKDYYYCYYCCCYYYYSI